MNREILFRGKCKDNGEWIEGSLTHDPYFGHCLIVTYSLEKGIDIRTKSVIPETVIQCTGLYDKNGNKIFEGDILEFTYDIDNDIEIKMGVVKWSKNGAGFFLEINDYYLEFDRVVAKECKVIGNIYNDADLLKEN